MADKILNYIEFRYEDGRKQCLRGKAAQDWMNFNKDMIKLATSLLRYQKKPLPQPTWKWERFAAEDNIPNRPGSAKLPEFGTSPDHGKYTEYD